ncbi:MAG: tetratricopeptide repeat protein [Alphaproteobacteria bacterium]|nr:tetratricopeptide repeat protein [Alphaproteobacteria bacterium]
MTSPPSSEIQSGAMSQERSPKVTDLRAPAFTNERASSLLGLATGAVRRGEHVLASRLFGRALEKDNDNLEAILGLASSQLMLGKGSAAETLANRALELAPKSADARLVLANLRIAQERHQDAIAYLRDAITVAPYFSVGFSRLGTILTALGEYAAAQPILLRALALAPTDADALNSIGNVVRANGDLTGAALHFERAMAANPGWLKPRLNLAATFEALGRIDDAIDALEGALAQDPRHIEAKVYLAGLLQRTGNHRRAQHILDEVIEVEPTHSGALFLAGLVRMQTDQVADAVGLLERAAAVAPGSSDVLVNLACAYRGVDQLEKALDVARRAVASSPDDPLALNALGSMLLDLKREDEAAEQFRNAIAAQADFHIAHVNLATALLSMQRSPEEAVDLLERALELGAPTETVIQKLGGAYRDAGNLPKAEALFRRAVDLDPDDSSALYALSAVLEMQGRRAEGVPVADQLIAGDPGRLHAYVVKALSSPNPDDGFAAVAKALAIDPDRIDALVVAGTLNDTANRPDEALRHYLRVLKLEPGHAKAQSRRCDIVLSLCDFAQRDALADEINTSLRENGSFAGFDIFNLQALDVTYGEIALAAKTATTALVQHLENNESDLWVPRITSEGPRIRIGYLLPYTWFHSLPMVLRRIVEAHDRSRFEVVGFTVNVGQREDAFEKSYKAAFDEFHSLVGLSPKKAARRIGAAGIDILIDVGGHTSISCLPIAAYRPAPVQAHLLGYSVTTGAPFIDYLVTDEIYIPRDQAALGSEQVVYMPNSFMPALEQPISKGTIRRAELNLPHDAFVLANFNHPCKFEPQAFGAWMEIMKQVPNAVLWLGDWFEATNNNLRREAEARGVASERLIFAPIAEHADHMLRLSQADLAVDNFLHGGGVTTIDALWAGLPVLSIAGDTPSSRLGATLLHGVKMDDMVVHSVDAYVEKAVALAGNPAAQAELRDRLAANRGTDSLFDFPRYVRDLERAYAEIWSIHRSGEPPRMIDLKVLS